MFIVQKRKNKLSIIIIIIIICQQLLMLSLQERTKNEKFELNINYDLDLGCFSGIDNREIISCRLRSVKNHDTLWGVQNISDFSW